MAISSTSRKAGPFTGNGTTTEFSFDFKVFDPTDVAVIRACPLGTEATLALGSAYDIALNEDQNEAPGGVVTLREPLGDGCRLVLLSVVPDLQPVDITNQGGFYPELLNDGLDRSTIQVQQVQERLGRAITVPVTADVADLSLPPPAAGQIIGWADGRLVNYGTDELVSVVTYGATRVDKFDGNGSQTSFGLSASPGSQNNLRVSIDGVVQVPGDDFTWAGGTTLAFVTAPPADTRIVVQYQEALADITGAVEAGAAAGASAGTAAAEAVVATKADTNGANALDSFVENQPFVPSAGIANWSVADELRQSVFLARWKTVANTWADAFDAAFAYLNTIGGGEVVVPRLDMALTRTVVVPYGRINIVGNGQGSSVFKVNFSGDVFRFKAASGFYLASSIRGCSIDYISGSAATSGYAVVFDGVGDCRAISVGFNKTHKGIGFIGNNRNCRAIDCGGSDVVDAEFVVSGGGNQYIQLGTTFDNLTSITSRSVRITATERVDLDFFTSSHHAAALEIKPDAGGFVQNVFANFNDMDAANVTGIIIDPTNANTVIRNLFFRGGSMSASAQVGLHVRSGAGQVGDVFLNGVMIQSNLREGCIFEKGRIHLNDCLVARNGSNAGEPGIRIKSGVTSFQMVGGAIGPILGGPNTAGRPMTLENFQLYGVVIDSGFAGTCSLDAVDLRGNVTGAIQNNSTAVVAARNCPGVGSRLVASGTDVLAAGTAVKTISPALLGYSINGATSIIVTPLGGGPSTKGAITSLAVGATTATSFDVITDPFVNLTNSLDFSWALYAPN